MSVEQELAWLRAIVQMHRDRADIDAALALSSRHEQDRLAAASVCLTSHQGCKHEHAS